MSAPVDVKRKSFLELINDVDSIPKDFDFDSFYKLILPLDPRPHGHISPSTLSLVPVFASAPNIVLDHARRTVTLTCAPTAAAVTETLQPICDYIVAHDVRGMTCGEHSEAFRIVGAAYSFEHATVERYPLPLLGCLSRGAHLTCFVRDADAPHGLRIWVAKRSADIFTYPGKWDTTVAGGVKADDSPLDCAAVEAEEEACIPESEARRRAVPVGVVSYVGGRRDKATGEWFRAMPSVVYCFDMELRPEEVPRPGDDEVERFELWTVDETVEHMATGQFKPNCNLVMLDFFARHGILTDNSLDDYVEIVTGLRRSLPVALKPLPELYNMADKST